MKSFWISLGIAFSAAMLMLSGFFLKEWLDGEHKYPYFIMIGVSGLAMQYVLYEKLHSLYKHAANKD